MIENTCVGVSPLCRDFNQSVMLRDTRIKEKLICGIKACKRDVYNMSAMGKRPRKLILFSLSICWNTFFFFFFFFFKLVHKTGWYGQSVVIIKCGVNSTDSPEIDSPRTFSRLHHRCQSHLLSTVVRLMP